MAATLGNLAADRVRLLRSCAIVTPSSPVPGVDSPERLGTTANLVTCARAVAAGVLLVYAFPTHSHAALWSGLAVYWTLDYVDGFMARLLRQETRFGAMFDGHADRMLLTLFLVGFLSMHHALYLPILLYIGYLFIVETMLYDQFLRFTVPSPTYFYAVNRYVWWMNWSAPAKFTSTVLMTGAVVFTPSAVGATIVTSIGAARLHSLYVAVKMPDHGAKSSTLAANDPRDDQ